MIGESERQLLPILTIIHGDLGRSPVLSKLNQGRHEGKIVCTENEVHVSSLFEDLLPLLLSNTSTHADHHSRFGSFELLHMPKHTVELLLGFLSHTTGVDQDEVRFLGRVDRVVILLEYLVELLGVMLVHLTPIGADIHPLLLSLR
jgi:hypothetical protein